MTDIAERSRVSPRMLIADDDLMVVRLLANRCASAGFEVETATNGIQALVKANRRHPDILIIDVNMPAADGLTVCARLLELSRKPMNIVVITGSAEPETLERCEGFGVQYVRKGAEFWSDLQAALIETFPDMADRIGELHGQRTRAEVSERPRVLMIDDDVSIELFLSSRLDKFGVELLCATNVAQGFQIACKEMPSVILSDYFMPNEEIPDFLLKLRTTPATENIPVLVFTGRNLDEMTQHGLMQQVCGKPGVARILRKSFNTDELFDELRKLCSFEYSRVAQ